MKPPKAREIIQLNITEASPQMPPDVKTALTMGAEGLEAIELFRKGSDTRHLWRLPSETEE